MVRRGGLSLERVEISFTKNFSLPTKGKSHREGNVPEEERWLRGRVSCR